jgi:hypothetical protein
MLHRTPIAHAVAPRAGVGDCLSFVALLYSSAFHSGSVANASTTP